MKKLLAVLCFVPVVFCLYVIIHASIIDPKGSLIILCVIVVGGVIVYEATALGARLWRGEKSKNGYVLIDGEWYPVEFGETIKSINSHLHENKESQ